MEANVKTVMHECSMLSDKGRISFGEVVGRLAGAGVERYHADLAAAGKTYYLPDGSAERVHGTALAREPAELFSAADVEAAIRAIQAGAIKYREFCERIASAGCVGYLVSIVGKRAVYYGRSGDLHVEWFPGAQPSGAP